MSSWSFSFLTKPRNKIMSASSSQHHVNQLSFVHPLPLEKSCASSAICQKIPRTSRKATGAFIFTCYAGRMTNLFTRPWERKLGLLQRIPSILFRPPIPSHGMSSFCVPNFKFLLSSSLFYFCAHSLHCVVDRCLCS